MSALSPFTGAAALRFLGPRERQVLEHVINRLSQKEIAAELDIGVSTVNTYTQRIYEKLHVRSRCEIIARCKSGIRNSSEIQGLC